MAKTAARQSRSRAASGNGRDGASKAARAGARRKTPDSGGRSPQALADPSLERLEEALRAAAEGDFETRLPARRKDAVGRLESAFNELAARNAALEAELLRIAQIIGREGRMTERAYLQGAQGGWSTTIGSVNGLIDDLVRPTTEVARVIVAVAEGDLSQKMALEIEGRPVKAEVGRSGTTVNSIAGQ